MCCDCAKPRLGAEKSLPQTARAGFNRPRGRNAAAAGLCGACAPKKLIRMTILRKKPPAIKTGGFLRPHPAGEGGFFRQRPSSSRHWKLARQEEGQYQGIAARRFRRKNYPAGMFYLTCALMPCKLLIRDWKGGTLCAIFWHAAIKFGSGELLENRNKRETPVKRIDYLNFFRI